MKKLFIITAPIVCLILTVELMAAPVGPPRNLPSLGWWDPGADGTTHQFWEFDNASQIAGPLITHDYTVGADDFINPYGIPEVHIWEAYWDEQSSWIAEENEILLKFVIYNRPEPLPIKDIYVELGISGGYIDAAEVVYFDSEGNIGGILNGVIEGNLVMFHIEPNPSKEDINIRLLAVSDFTPKSDGATILQEPATLALDYAHIDTICTIPEPGTVALLALGGLLFIKKRKR